MKIIVLISLLLLPVLSKSQTGTITTVAGIGTAGDSGDFGLATAAKIYGGLGGVFDKAGNFYFAERTYHKVRKLSPSGIIYTVAGTGTAGFSGDSASATAAKLNNPLGVAVDSGGNIYIADLDNYRIRKVDIATGIITTIAGNGIVGYSGDSGVAINASFSGPTGLCVDPFGNVYVGDIGNNVVRKISTSGIITTYAGTGVIGYGGDGGLATLAELGSIEGICSDSYGNIYVTCGDKVRKITSATAIISTVAGNGISGFSGDGDLADSAELAEPFDVAVDIDGNVYIADTHNNRIRKVDTSGVIHSIVGNGIGGYDGDHILADTAEIHWPQGVAIDGCGDLYINDLLNFRIRKVTYPPTPIALTNTISAIDTTCASTPTTYTTATTASSGAVTYQWYVNGTPITGATASTYTYTPADADSIRCVATATSPCTSAVTSSNSILMSVTPITTPTITVTAPAAAAVGSTVTVNATVAGIIGSYSINWYNNSTLFSTTAAPATTYTKAAGTDHITATILPPTEGCYDSTASAAVAVAASTTGVRNTSLSFGEGRGEVIYPNPAHSQITITADHLANVTITNLLGQTMVTKDSKEDQITINIEAFPAGVYTLKITTTQGEKTITKFIKQ